MQSNLFGSAIAFIVGPYYVSDNSLGSLMNYNYMGVALSAFNLVCALAYFPAQPPTPPSVSSGEASGLLARGHRRACCMELSPVNRRLLMSACVPCLPAAAQAHEGAFTPRKLWASLAQMCRNKNFIILCLAYGITCGACRDQRLLASLLMPCFARARLHHADPVSRVHDFCRHGQRLELDHVAESRQSKLLARPSRLDFVCNSHW